MKVLMINGSPHVNGNTARVLEEMEKVFNAEGVDTETICIGTNPVRGCIACYKCAKTGRCVFDNEALNVNEIAEKFKTSDGLVVASPVYYSSSNGSLIALLDRLFYSTHFDKTMKVGASVAVARRCGTMSVLDELNKYFTIAGMPVVSSQYWNNVFGRNPKEVEQDGEGMQIMRTLAKNMTFLMKSIELGKEKFGIPEKEEKIATNYIR